MEARSECGFCPKCNEQGLCHEGMASGATIAAETCARCGVTRAEAENDLCPEGGHHAWQEGTTGSNECRCPNCGHAWAVYEASLMQCP